MSGRNVLNAAEVGQFLDEVAGQIDRAELLHWLRTTARRWILNHHDRYELIEHNRATGELVLTAVNITNAGTRAFVGALPDWASRALASGDELFVLSLDASLRKRIRRTMQGLGAALTYGALNSAERVSFPDAEQVAREQRLRVHKVRRQQSQRRNGNVPVFRTNKATIVKLTSAQGLAEEGQRMQHCVGGSGYVCDVREGYSEIYSLRDEMGRSRATLEVIDGDTLWQIKGFANGSVDERYRPVLQAFARSRGYDVENDTRNLRVPSQAFESSADRLADYLIAEGGLDLLRANRLADHRALCGVRLPVLLRTIAANARQLDSRVLTRIYAALAPQTERVLRLESAEVIRLYGGNVLLFRVRLPVALANLVKMGVFSHRRVNPLARAFNRNLEQGLSILALQRPDRLFAIGPLGAHRRWEVSLMESSADVLARSRLDLTTLRYRRHNALRQGLNRRQRAVQGRRRTPAYGHQMIRNLLDGKTGEYVL